MGRISEEDITRVREATDIVELVSEYVSLRRRGSDFWGCCPFHNEKTPSFKVNAQTQLWHCFGQCSEGGDVFKFIMRKEHFDFPDAVRFLANKAHIEIVEEEGGMPSGYRARLLSACDKAAEFYHTQLMRGRGEGNDDARRYLSKRGLGGQIPKTWNLGYAPGKNSLTTFLAKSGFSAQEMIDANLAMRTDGGSLRDRFYNRVMFPIRDLQGRTIAFGGRVIGKGEPKYINTSNCPLFSKRENLYGIDAAKSSIVSRGTAIVVEGYTDVIAMHEAGFTNTVATLGTALTPQHIKVLNRFANKVIYLFDGDAAGQKAAERAGDLITPEITPESGARQVALFVAVIPGDMDPAEYIAEHGEEGMQGVLDSATALLRFVIDKKLAEHDLSTPELRSQALPKILAILAPIKDSILADEYLNYLADVFKLDFQRMRKTLDSLKADRPVRNYDDDNPAYGQWSQVEAAPDSEPAAPRFTVPADGVGKWEVQLACLYVFCPAVRATIAQGIEEMGWSSELFSAIAEVAESCGIAAEPTKIISRCLADYPEAEAVFSDYVPGSYDDEEAQQLAELMLKERKRASLSDRIASINSRLKYSQGLSEQESDMLFAEVASLQKELSELRK